MLLSRQEIGQSIRLVRPSLSYLTGECRKVHEPPDYSQAETVQHLVRVVYPPTGLCDEESPSLLCAVPINGEGLAGILPRLLRPAEYAARIA
jgi:hypothetical protein